MLHDADEEHNDRWHTANRLTLAHRALLQARMRTKLPSIIRIPQPCGCVAILLVKESESRIDKSRCTDKETVRAAWELMAKISVDSKTNFP